MSDTRLEAINRALPLTLNDHLRELKLGRVLAGHVPQQLLGRAPAASSYELGTLQAVGLPHLSRAAVIDRAIARAGGVTGELAIQAYGATPTTGQVAVSPSGDVVVLASDAITSLDVYWRPVCGDVVETTLPVATAVMTLPSHLSGRAMLLLEAEATKGSVTGKKIILVPASAAVAAGRAALAIDRSKVYFNNATDGVTEARVKLLVAPILGLAEALAAAPSTL